MPERDEIQFITEEEFQAALKDRAAMNSLFNKVYSEILEYVIRSVPNIIQTRLREDAKLMIETIKFYDQNKDLVSQRELIAVISNELKAANPGWSIQELLKETGEEARRRLKLTSEVTKLEESRLSKETVGG